MKRHALEDRKKSESTRTNVEHGSSPSKGGETVRASLHRTAGNQAAQRLVTERAIQPKLTVNSSSDPGEREGEALPEEVPGGRRPSEATAASTRNGVSSDTTATSVSEYSPEQARERQRRDEAQIVDVRPASEFRRGHIPGAIHVPASEVSQRANQIAGGKEIVVCCRTGQRSTELARRLASSAGPTVGNVVGGYEAWTKGSNGVDETRISEDGPFDGDRCDAAPRTRYASSGKKRSFGPGSYIDTRSPPGHPRELLPIAYESPDSTSDHSDDEPKTETSPPPCWDRSWARFDWQKGEMSIVNKNGCCTRECTQRHERRHVEDLGGCLEKAAEEFDAARRKLTVKNRWKQWYYGEGVRDWTECNAYHESVRCARRLWRSHRCESESSECCYATDYYLDLVESQFSGYCSSAPSSPPPCPF